MVYLDLFPILSQPLILVTDPETCSQLTQVTPQPRHSLFRWALAPLTGARDLTCVDMATHRLWRSRLNPSFSPKNMMSNIDAVLEEVTVFTDKLKDKTGNGGSWGELFTLYDDTAGLTFDVILKFCL